MSNTRHSLPTSYYRMMRVQNRRKAGASVLEDIADADVPVRHGNRLKNYWALIPEPWDDRPYSSSKEWHNKNHWKEWLDKQDAPHYSKPTAKRLPNTTEEPILDGFMIIDFSKGRQNKRRT